VRPWVGSPTLNKAFLFSLKNNFIWYYIQFVEVYVKKKLPICLLGGIKHLGLEQASWGLPFPGQNGSVTLLPTSPTMQANSQPWLFHIQQRKESKR
jgi:hypothetical protein